MESVFCKCGKQCLTWQAHGCNEASHNFQPQLEEIIPVICLILCSFFRLNFSHSYFWLVCLFTKPFFFNQLYRRLIWNWPFFNYWSHCVCRTRVRPLPIPWLHNGVTPASKGSRLVHPTWCRSELGQWLVMAATAARPISAPTYRVGTSLNFEFWKLVDVSNQTKQQSLYGIAGCSSLYWFQIHGIILNVCSFNHFLSLILKADPPKSWQEQFPLIVGSITASLVFIIAVVVIAIVCLRSEYNPSSQTWSMWQAKSVQVENAEKNPVRDFKCQLWLRVLCGTIQHSQWIALPPVRPLNSRLAFGICE